ncbi:MAG: hypothetical protein J07HR59_00913 [Halorubrum sp. J07HR59]|nr:MAG: hypothetical protein J07HR59_00913 [Halorubrum sp. J07HR59]
MLIELAGAQGPITECFHHRYQIVVSQSLRLQSRLCPRLQRPMYHVFEGVTVDPSQYQIIE